MTSIAQLNKLLEKTADWDKDERYMATNDLCTALNQDIKIDENMEQRICAAVLKQLDDPSNDVQSVAVKCLAIITKKVQQAQISDVCKKLCSLVLDGKDALRDVYSIGLKTLIADVPESMGQMVAEQLTNKLLTGIGKQDSEAVQRECLDIMTDLLRRFGHLNALSHNEVMKQVVRQLQSDRAVIRKRSAHCLGALVVVSSDALLNSLMQILLDGIEQSNANSQGTRTLIQTIGTISRTVGYRLSKHLDRVVPLFLRFCGDPTDEAQQTDAANELRESCFPGLESFVLRCPREVAPFLSDILRVAVAFTKYDPNYAYESDSEDAMDVDGEEGEEEGEDYEDEDGGGGSDDDDTSWKVRKAAVKVIVAVVQARPDLLSDTWAACGPQLVRRFKEREENVRLDILACFTALLQASHASTGAQQAAREKAVVRGLVRQRSTSGDYLTPGALNAAGAGVGRNNHSPLPLQGSPSDVQAIVSACCKQLAGPSAKTKSAVFVLLRALVHSLHGGLDKSLPKLLPLVEKSLADKQQALRLDTLCFVRACLEEHAPSAVQPCLVRLLDAVVAVVGGDWYKVTAEALRVLAAMVPALRPMDAQTGLFDDSFTAYKPCVRKIYAAVQPRMEALDLDQEIKVCALLAMGTLMSHAGDELATQLPSVLHVYKKRLENETTRSSTLKALTGMARSRLDLDLSEFLQATAGDLAMFLRQASRSLKQLTLQTLEAIAASPSTKLVSAEADVLLSEAATVVNDMDLHLSHLALRLADRLLARAPAVCGPALLTHLHPRMLMLARSALVQGSALTSLIRLFRSVVQASLPGMSYADLFAQLYSSNVGGADLSKQALTNLSRCVAGIACNPQATQQALQRFVADLQNAGTTEAQKQLALLCLGEVGQAADLASLAGLKDLVLACFESKSEDTKLAAAFALGHIAVGNMGTFLPLVLQPAGTSKHQYLLLAAVKDMVVVFANQQKDFQPHLAAVLPVLLQQCKAEEDSVRTIVAECLGVLTTMLPDQIIPVLLQLSQDVSDKLSRRMIGNALRFSLSRSAASAGALQAITTEMHRFLPLLQDEDLDVKKAALLMVNTAVHHNASTIEAHLGTTVVPALIETLQIKLERVVDLGPFKHRVDDNMPLRKIALTCLETILDNSPERLDSASLVQVMPTVLADKDELKAQAHQILAKLCQHCPALVVGVVEQLIAPLSKTIAKKAVPKEEGAGPAAGAGPEAERALDLVRSGVRAVLAVSGIEDVAQISRKWGEFADKVRSDEYTTDIVRALETERSLEAF